MHQKTADQKVVDSIELFLSSGEQEDREFVIQMLCDFSAETLYDLYFAVPEIKDFKDFCESSDFKEALAQGKHYIKEYKMPEENLISIDEALAVRPFQQFLGYHLVAVAEEAKDPLQKSKLLTKACETNSYHGLSARMDEFYKSIVNLPKDTTKDLSYINTAIKKILKDAAAMGNLYRAPGFFRAAAVLQAAAVEYSKYFQVREVELENDLYMNSLSHIVRLERPAPMETPKIVVVLQDVLEKMLLYYYLAYDSSELPLSVSLNAGINHGKKLLEGMEKYFTNWEGGQNYLLSNIPKVFNVVNLRLLFPKVQTQVQEEEKLHPREFAFKKR